MQCIKPVAQRMNVKSTFFDFVRPCGKCIPCRITKRQEWTFRLLLEAREHRFTYFVTLTYNDAHMPEGGNLDPVDFRNWLKRFRKLAPGPIRFFGVGEYGLERLRPHYHALIFTNEEIPVEIRRCPIRKKNYWHSDLLDTSWQDRDSVSIGVHDCSPIPGRGDAAKVARYVAGYTVKKLLGEKPGVFKSKIVGKLENLPQYTQVFVLRGWRLEGLVPQFTRMSMRPGLGVKAIERFGRALRGHGVAPEGMTIDDDQVENGLHMVRLHGKLWPIGRTLHDKLMAQLVTDVRGQRTRAADLAGRTLIKSTSMTWGVVSEKTRKAEKSAAKIEKTIRETEKL